MKEKRISFGDFDAQRIYEWRLALNQGLGEGCCEHCKHIEKRLKKYLGSSAKGLEKLVKKNPYFKKPLSTLK